MTNLHYKADNIKLFCGDCLEILQNINDEFDCVVTSPPYNVGGFHAGNIRYGAYESYDDDMAEDDYQDWQVEVLNTLYDKTTDDGFCFYVHKNRIVDNQLISPISWIERSEWQVMQDVIIDLRSGPNVDKRRFFPVHEILFVLCKSRDQKLRNERCLTSVWQMPKQNRKDTNHPAPFHKSLPAKCIDASTEKGDKILDPFAGSGATLQAAKELGRAAVGIELQEKYCNTQIENLRQNTLQFT